MSTLTHETKNAILYGPKADGFNTDPVTLTVSFVDYTHATIFVGIGPTAGAGTGKVQVQKCTAADGTGATAMDFKYRAAYGSVKDDLSDLAAAVAADGFTTNATADDLYAIELDGREMGEGYNYARLKLTEVVNDPKDVVVYVVMSGARYRGAQGVMPTCLP